MLSFASSVPEHQYFERIMRLVVWTIAIVLFIPAIILLFTIFTARQQVLREVHSDVLATISALVVEESEQYRDEAQGLADDPLVRNYLLGIGSNVFNTTVAAAALIENQPDRYLRIQYLTRAGTVLLEVTNENGVPRRTAPSALAGTTFANRNTDSFQNIAIGQIREPAVGEISLIREDNGQPATPLALQMEIYAPIFDNIDANLPVGIVVATVTLEEVVQPIRNASGVTGLDVINTSGRHIILLDERNHILADSSPSSASLLLNFDAPSGNAAGVDLYEDLVRYENTIEAPSFTLQQAGTQIYSRRSIDIFGASGPAWALYMVDSAPLIYGQTALFITTIILLTVSLGAGASLAMRVLILRILTPVQQAQQRITTMARTEYQTIAHRPSQHSLTTSEEPQAELISSVETIARQIDELNNELDEQIRRRNRDLQVAGRIGRESVKQRNLDDLLKRAINLICNELGFYHAQVFLVDSTKTVAQLSFSRGEAGSRLLEQGHQIAVGSETVVGTVTAEARPVIVNDTLAAGVDSPHGFNPLLPETRAEMGLPLIVGDEVIGALDVQSRFTNAFSEEDAPTYQLLADQLAIAIYNEQLREQSQERIQQIDALNRQLTREAWSSLNRAANLEGYYGDRSVEGQLKAPISIRGEIIGEVNIDLPEGQRPTDGDDLIVQAVAGRMALALENARLFQETQLSLAGTETLYALSRQLNEADSLDDVLVAMVETVASDASGGQIWLFDSVEATDQWLECIADYAHTPRAENATLFGNRMKLTDHPFLRKVSPTEPVFVPDILRVSNIDHGFLRQFAVIEMRALVFVPLNIRGDWKGFVTIEFARPRTFTNQDERIYSALIGQAGVAVDNRLLFSQTENALAQQEKLYAASRLVNTTQNLSDLVYAAVATADDPRLNYWLGLLEGDPDSTGWPNTVHIIARSEDGTVIDDSRRHPLRYIDKMSLNQREPQIIKVGGPGEENPAERSEVAEWVASLGLRFMAIFPLYSENVPLALFYIVSNEAYTLSANDDEIYRALTGQMSTQIQKRRLLERTEQTLSETRRLFAATRAITGASDIAGTYDAIGTHLYMPFIQQTNVTLSLTILLAQPEPSVNAPELRYEYQWLSEPHRTPAVQKGTVITQEAVPFSQMISDNDDTLLIFSDLKAYKDELPPAMYAVLSENGARTAAAAPLFSRGQWFGVLVVRSNQPDVLDDSYTRFIGAISDQIAIAVENQRLIDVTEYERERLNTILATLPTGVLVLDVETLHPTLHNLRAQELLGREIDPHRPFAPEYYQLYRTNLDELYAEEELATYVAREANTRIVNEDIVVKHDFSQTDLQISAVPIYNADGSQRAIVVALQDVSNLRAIEKDMQETLQETIMLYEMQSALTEADSLNELLDNALMQLQGQQIGQVFIIIQNQNDGNLSLARHSVENPSISLQVLETVLRSNTSAFNDITRASSIPEEARRAFEQADIRSLLALPLVARSRVMPMGWIILTSDEPEAFTLDTERIISSMVDMTSTELDNQLLFASTQEALKETETLFNAATRINQARSMDDLYDALYLSIQSLEPNMVAGFLYRENQVITMFEEGFAQAVADGLDFDALVQAPLRNTDGLFIESFDEPSSGLIYEKLQDVKSIGAFAAIDLRVQGSFSGRLLLGFHQQRTIEEGERRLLRAIADGASVVIDNQLLIEQIQATLREQSVLYQASKSLLEVSTPGQALNVITEYVTDTHVNQVFIALLNTPNWDDPNATVEVAASWQSDSEVDLLGVTLSPDQFPAWKQLSTQEPVLVIADVLDPELEMDIMESTSIQSLDTRSLVIIPLRVPNRAIGAIWIGSREAHEYNESDMRVFQSVGEQTSLTLEAERLLQQTEARARQLQTSAAISQRINRLLDLNELLQEVVELIKNQFGYDQVQVFLMDEKDEYAVLQASTGEAGQQLLSIGHRLAKGSQSVIGRVTADAQLTVALDTADANVIHQPNPYLPMTRSEMALPLMIGTRVVGTLDVQSNRANAFTEEDRTAMTTLASQISVAIQNARLYGETRDRAAAMTFLFEVTTSATSAETVDAALRQIADNVLTSMNAVSVVIYLPQVYEDMDGNRKTMLEPSTVSAQQEIDLHTISDVEVGDASNLIGAVSAQRELRSVGDIAEEPTYLHLAQNAQSVLIVPLGSGNNLSGVICVESQRANAYDADALQLMRTLSGSISAVIENTVLLEQLRETNEQLREVDRLKNQFLANMSHELRTPLNSIIGFSRVMLKGIDGPLTETQEQDLTTIFNSGQHLLALINDILDSAKIANDRLDLKFDYFDVKKIVESVNAIAVGLLKEQNLDYNVEVAPNLPRAYGDEFRSRQILLNIVTNAIKYNRDGGSVLVRVYAVHGEEGEQLIQFDVADTGIGIDQKDMPLLFEQFRQVDSSLTRTVGGTGLGLPIAKSLTELQGGIMKVESEVNVGSTFSFTIPTQPGAEKDLLDADEEAEGELKRATNDPRTSSGLIRREDVEKAKQLAEQQAKMENGNDEASKPPAQTPTSEPAVPTTDDLKKKGTNPLPILNEKRLVLLIEDNKTMVDQFRRALQREGFEVQVADHASYATAMVGQLRPNVVILDVNFANGEGWKLLESLKDRDDTFDIPIVVTTMSGESERAYQLGAHTFLQRPFVPADLMEAVLAAEKESQRERILIIDDQPEAIRLLRQLLEEHADFRVFSAESGDEGISLVARRRPDLVILDLRMPGKDGFAVLDELRNNPETAKIPVLIVTGDVDLTSTEREQLANLRVLPKADISQAEYDQFIDNVRTYLEANNGTNL